MDGKSIDLLKGSQIDYVDTLMGAGFTVNNRTPSRPAAAARASAPPTTRVPPRAARTDLRARSTRRNAPNRTSQAAGSADRRLFFLLRRDGRRLPARWTFRSFPFTRSCARASRCRSTSSSRAIARWWTAAWMDASAFGVILIREGRETGPNTPPRLGRDDGRDPRGEPLFGRTLRPPRREPGVSHLRR